MSENNTVKSIADINTMNDLVFKFIFGSKERKGYTISLLNSVLLSDLKTPIVDLSFIDREHPTEKDKGKSTRFDVACQLDNGTTVIVEVQLVDQKDAVSRMLYYWAKKYADQLESGQTYSELKPVYLVAILNFKLHENPSPHTHCIIYNPEEKQRETDQFSIHWIEVPKLDVHQDLSQKSQLERWVAFFDNRKLSESERNNLMTDMTINQAYSEIDRFFADKKQRDAYEARERQYRDYISDLTDAKAEGRAEGKAEGRAESTIEVARVCLKKGFDTATICELTQLSPEVVEALRSEV